MWTIADNETTKIILYVGSPQELYNTYSKLQRHPQLVKCTPYEKDWFKYVTSLAIIHFAQVDCLDVVAFNYEFSIHDMLSDYNIIEKGRTHAVHNLLQEKRRLEDQVSILTDKVDWKLEEPEPFQQLFH